MVRVGKLSSWDEFIVGRWLRRPHVMILRMRAKLSLSFRCLVVASAVWLIEVLKWKKGIRNPISGRVSQSDNV